MNEYNTSHHTHYHSLVDDPSIKDFLDLFNSKVIFNNTGLGEVKVSDIDLLKYPRMELLRNTIQRRRNAGLVDTFPTSYFDINDFHFSITNFGYSQLFKEVATGDGLYKTINIFEYLADLDDGKGIKTKFTETNKEFKILNSKLFLDDCIKKLDASKIFDKNISNDEKEDIVACFSILYSIYIEEKKFEYFKPLNTFLNDIFKKLSSIGKKLSTNNNGDKYANLSIIDMNIVADGTYTKYYDYNINTVKEVPTYRLRMLGAKTIKIDTDKEREDLIAYIRELVIRYAMTINLFEKGINQRILNGAEISGLLNQYDRLVKFLDSRYFDYFASSKLILKTNSILSNVRKRTFSGKITNYASYNASTFKFHNEKNEMERYNGFYNFSTKQKDQVNMAVSLEELNNFQFISELLDNYWRGGSGYYSSRYPLIDQDTSSFVRLVKENPDYLKGAFRRYLIKKYEGNKKINKLKDDLSHMKNLITQFNLNISMLDIIEGFGDKFFEIALQLET